jgi:hypothetical protein
MDPASQAVFGALLLNVIVTSLIVMGWLIIRKFRGDKQEVPKAHHRDSYKPASGRVSVLSGGVPNNASVTIKGSGISNKDIKSEGDSDE